MFLAAFTSAWQAYPQAVHTNRACLSRDLASTCPHAEHRWLVNAALTFSTRPGAFSCRRRTSRPHPDRRMPQFSPAFCRTRRPGFCTVPFADRVMFMIWRSSDELVYDRRHGGVPGRGGGVPARRGRQELGDADRDRGPG